jgi:hypothetical protein
VLRLALRVRVQVRFRKSADVNIVAGSTGLKMRRGGLNDAQILVGPYYSPTEEEP